MWSNKHIYTARCAQLLNIIVTFTFGFLDFKYCPTPETVPPLPIPIMKMSTFPLVSSHISGPVVSKCTCIFNSIHENKKQNERLGWSRDGWDWENLSVSRIGELLKHESVWRRIQKLVSFLDCASHSLGRIGEDQIGTKRPHTHPPLQAGIRWHCEHHFVAFHCSHKGHADPHVSWCGLNQRRLYIFKLKFPGNGSNEGKDEQQESSLAHLARGDESLLLSVIDHG